MGKHRTRLTILADILSVVNNGNKAKKTQIMYQAYLSYSLLVQYLTDIIRAGLIIQEDENCYKLTKKGETFLAKIKEYDKTRKSVDEQVNNVEYQKLLLDEICPYVEVQNDKPHISSRNIEHRNE